MRRQQGELQTRLREETQKKEELEQQIILDQRRIRELEINLKVREEGGREGREEGGEEREESWEGRKGGWEGSKGGNYRIGEREREINLKVPREG